MSDVPDQPDPPELPLSSLGEAIAADAVVAHAAEHTGHGGPLHTHCENCGSKLEGPYCHRCGQHDFDIHRSFGHVFMEVLESFFHFDAKFFQNIVVLLFRPGRLTAAFNSGKRASQMPPFRLYVFVSILFFFLTFIGNKGSAPVVHAGADVQAESAAPAKIPSLDAAPQAAGQSTEEAAKTRAAMDKLRTVMRADKEPAANSAHPAAAQPVHGRTPGFLDGFINGLTDLQNPEAKQHMVHSFVVAIPKLILFCLPLFALYTRVLFRKSGQVYLQHLVLAVHYHTFIFLWLMVTDGWTFLLGFVSYGLANLFEVGAYLWLVIYPYFMLKYLFGNSWKRIILKNSLLGVAYFTTLGMGFAVTAIIALALL